LIFLPIPDQGVKEGTSSRIRIRNTGFEHEKTAPVQKRDKTSLPKNPSWQGVM
jgi:hypothetical protein